MGESVWAFYANSDDPVRHACIAEWNSWIDEIPSDRGKALFQTRLLSSDDSDHFSARLELFLHHYFKSQGIDLEYEPDLPASNDHPDFVIHHANGSFYLEATIRKEERSTLEQEAFADALKGALSEIASPHVVRIDVTHPAPSARFLPEVKDFLLEKLRTVDSRNGEESRFRWYKSVGRTLYELRFSLSRRSDDGNLLRVVTNSVTWSGMHNLLYTSIDDKAHKYGNLTFPLVIAVWGLSFPFETEEKWALYGTQTLTWNRDQEGHAIKGSDRQGTEPDGVFTIIQDGQPRNQKVSAVLFYQHRLADNARRHVLRVYHNPFARLPLPVEVFSADPQFAAKEIGDQVVEMRWLGEPSADERYLTSPKT